MNNTPKILSYCALHYGACYLEVAIRAVYDVSDKIILLYSPEPSYGYGTHVQCPDGEAELRAIANKFDKVEWVVVHPHGEGNHRAQIFDRAQGYDGILVFDADEVYNPIELPKMIEYCHNSKSYRFGIDGYINFWKSFNHACYDGFRPIRYFNLHNKDGQEDVKCTIYHFGCAQRMPIMEYKLLIHGHKAEIRPGWLDMYKNWKEGQGDLHLVSIGLWNAVPFDKTMLPELLKLHRNYSKEVIE